MNCHSQLPYLTPERKKFLQVYFYNHHSCQKKKCLDQTEEKIRIGTAQKPLSTYHHLHFQINFFFFFFEGLYFQENFIWKTSIFKTENENEIVHHRYDLL